MKRPSNFSDEPSSVVSTIASPSSLPTGARIIVLGQDVVERGAEPGQAAAQIERSDLERQYRVVDRNGRRRADRGFDGDFRVGGL